jgi:hypothetical protein
MLPFFKKKNKLTENNELAQAEKPTRKVYVLTAHGRQEQAWLDSNAWEPPIQTMIPAEAAAPRVVVHYGTYGSDGMRRDGPPAGAYSAVYEQYRTRGRDTYTNDEHRLLTEWDTRLPYPGFDPKEGSLTLDIYSED